MTHGKIGVGIVGLSAGGGWAATAHLPALRRLPSFEIRGLTASSLRSAAKAAQKYGVPYFSDDAAMLAARPDIDILIITVKLPDHRRLVEAAFLAGKKVYCEWPLGVGLDEAIDLQQLALRRKTTGFIGLQARSAPAIRFIRDMIRDGAIGDVLSTSMIGSDPTRGVVVDPRYVYAQDAANGVSTLTIPFAHAVDALCFCFGEWRSLSGVLATQRAIVRLAGTNEAIQRSVPDQVAVNGILGNGAVASVHYRGGSFKGTNFLWEINGSKGDIVITAASGHLQYEKLDIRLAREGDDVALPMQVPAGYRLAEAGEDHEPSFTLTHAYANLLRDLTEGTHRVPTFADAVLRHRMLHAIEVSAQTGTVQNYLQES